MVQVAGFPIYTERKEVKNLWSLLDTVKHQIPAPFTLTELMALYFGRDMLKVFSGTVFHDSRDSLFHKVKTTLPQDDGSIIFETVVTGTEEVRFWIMSWRSNAEVLEPLSLRGEIRAEAERISEIYAKGLEHNEKPVTER